MRTIDDLLNATNGINIDLEYSVALGDIADQVPEIMRQQLRQGTAGDDGPITNVNSGSPYYSKGYAAYKGRDFPIDLHDTGSFYNGITAAVEQEGLNLFSDDSKSESLQKRYSEEILLPDSDSKNEIAQLAGEQLIKNVSKELST